MTLARGLAGSAPIGGTAIKWYRLAADKGLASAQYNLLLLYYGSREGGPTTRWARKSGVLSALRASPESYH